MADLSLEQHEAMDRVLREVVRERLRQHAKWGEQNPPDGTGSGALAFYRQFDTQEQAKDLCRDLHESDNLTYAAILWEELVEAFAESDPAKLRAELVQVAAVAVQWVEAIDRRGGR